MAYFLCSGYSAPVYLDLLADWDKIKSAATETLEEYLVTHRFGLVPERISVIAPISWSLTMGYKANVKKLYYKYVKKLII